jgi:predicted metal-dependent phosphoesterase TrpH
MRSADDPPDPGGPGAIDEGERRHNWHVDPHVKVLDDRVVERAQLRGLDAIVYAPHFTRLPSIRHRADAYSSDDLRVIPAREIFTGSWRNRRHLLAIGLEEPVPDFITLDAAIAACERQGAAVVVPHPGFATVSLGRREIERHREAIDAVEVYNPKHLPHHNRRAGRLADRIERPVVASSYAHLRGTVGEVWTTFEEPVEDAATLAEALRSGARRTVGHRPGVGHRARCLAEVAHLGWENSWEKLDRVVLSGMEPTHPHHAAYGSEFDDVACY